MSPLNAQASAGPADASAATDRRKAVLFCPRCDHESGVDGDWVVAVRESTAELRCPDCRELLTRRWLSAKERSTAGR